ncbi:hypothetical protein LPB140_07355 [Sphingorhabdus lutea]|uniref:Class I SAM-dependent RNA methyltransferase n=1 Tax=Sphingorhabdus lutea TaxID=1913578 RepID=A0A1L3JBW8_9SPHN|nr:class I SAM-dependent RNA methyltransferase [Sphingorhabdus lutea]APG62634.1 hypothetical protein LPB140_07355 [Sphingorhabdus lutea]
MSQNNEIIRFGSRGDGVTADGRYVAGAVPGDMLIEQGGIKFGPGHQEPPCKHADICGGCQMQHVTDGAYLGYLKDNIRGALLSQGIDNIDIKEPFLCNKHSRRRASFRAHWAGKKLLFGFNTQQSHRIINLEQCLTITPALWHVYLALKPFLNKYLPHKSAVIIKLTEVDQGVDLLIEGWLAEGLEQIEAITDFAKNNKLARISMDDGLGPVAMWEPEPVTINLDDIHTPFPPFSFLQATRDGESALKAAVGLALQNIPVNVPVADLFAGLGTFSFYLAQKHKVYAADATLSAITNLKNTANRAQLPIFTEHRDLYRRPLSSQELNRFKAVVIDPPRAGARDQIEQICASQLSDLAYVSCNPATFSRDAKLLIESGMELLWIQAVGQFRWSTHVELVAHFKRKEVI